MLKLTPEEEQMLKDVDYDHIGDQLGIDNWKFATIISVCCLILIAMMWFIGKYLIVYLLK